MLRQVRSIAGPFLTMTLIAGVALLVRLGLVLHALR
jgi:hypothetical protein